MMDVEERQDKKIAKKIEELMDDLKRDEFELYQSQQNPLKEFIRVGDSEMELSVDTDCNVHDVCITFGERIMFQKKIVLRRSGECQLGEDFSKRFYQVLDDALNR